MTKNENPADPSARSIQQGLYRVFHRLIHLDARLDVLRNVTPRERYDELRDDRNDIDHYGEVPGHEEVRSSPEEPRLDVLFNDETLRCGVSFVPIEVDQNCGGYQDSGEEGRTNQGRKQEGDDSPDAKLALTWELKTTNLTV
jgi:hypothetical protein